MARPTKTLQEHLRDGSFRADRCADLLLGPLVDDEELAGLQATYRMAASTDEQRLVACLRPGGEAPRGTEAAPEPQRPRRRRGGACVASGGLSRRLSLAHQSRDAHRLPTTFLHGRLWGLIRVNDEWAFKPPAESSRSPRRSFTTPRRGGGALGDARGRCVGGI